MNKELHELIVKAYNAHQIEAPYMQVVEDAFDKLDEASVLAEQTEQAYSVLEATINKLIESNDAKQAASMFMAHATSASDLTIGQINVLMAIISLSFIKGNEILLHLNRYNSCMANLCNDQLNMLKMMSPVRMMQKSKDADVENVTQLINSQFVLL